MIDKSTPHLMRRAVPGDTRCADCEMTAGTKAHRAARASDQGTTVPAPAVRRPRKTPAVDVPAVVRMPTDTVPAPAVVPAVVVTEPAAELVALYAPQDTAGLAQQVHTWTGFAAQAHAAGRVGEAQRTTVQVIGRAVALLARADFAGDIGDVPAVIRDQVAAILAGDVPAVAYTVHAHSPDGDYTSDSALSVHATEAGAEAWIDDNVGDASVGNGRVLVIVPMPAGDQGDQEAPAVDVPAVAGDQEAPATMPAGTIDGGEKIMKATVTRTDLIAALTYTHNGVPTRPGVPALAGVVLTVAGDTLTAHTFDWYTYRAGDVPAVGTVAGTVTVGSKTLLTAVKSLPKSAKSIMVAGAGASLVITAGGESITLPTMPTEDMPATPLGTTHVIGTIDARTLATLAGAGAGAAGTDETHPIMCAVRVRTDGKHFDVATTDRYRLHVAAGTWSPAMDENGEWVAPGSEYVPAAKAFAEFAALAGKRAGKAPATVTVSATCGAVKIGDRVTHSPLYELACDGYRMITECTSGEFPAVDRVFPASPAGTATVDGKALAELVTRVTAGRKDSKQARTYPLIVQLHGDTLTAQFGDRGGDMDVPFREASMPATIAGDVPEYFGASPEFLVEAVNAAGAAGAVTLHLVNARKPLVVTGATDGVRALVMPIRVELSDRDVIARQGAAPAVDQVATVPATVPAVATVDQVDAAPAAIVDVPATAGDMETGRRRAIATVTRTVERAGGYVIDAGTVKRIGAGEIGDRVAAIIGVNVCREHAPHGCDLAHTADARTHVALPAVVDPADVEAERVRRNTYNLPAHLVTTIDTLTEIGESAGYNVRALCLPAGTATDRHGKWTTEDTVTVQIGTTDSFRNPDMRSHNVVSWDSWTDIARVRPNVPLHTLDQVRAYLAEYTRRASSPARFAADDLEGAYHAVTGAMAYGKCLPERALTAVPAVGTVDQVATATAGDAVPADFTPYAGEIDGCVCTLCAALVATVAGGTVDQGAARVLLSALADGSHVRTVPAAVPAPAVDTVDRVATVPAVSVGVSAPAGDQGDTYAGMVREVIAGATWSFGVGHFGGGKRRTGKAFHGPIMHPALPARRLSREEWSAVADQVSALGGGRWMSDVKGFACESGDVGNPWRAATKSTRERVAAWLTAGQSAAPVAPVDQVAGVAPVTVPMEVPAAPVAPVDQVAGVAPVTVPMEVPAAPVAPVDQVAVEVPAATVTLVYADDVAPVAPVDRVANVAAGPNVTGHGAHAQRIHVTGIGELDGYRFHLVVGSHTRQLGKAVRSALGVARAQLGASFNVTAPAGSRTINVAARSGESVTDWSLVLAAVATVLGDAVAADSATCGACDRSAALVDA